jgi:glycosyltransferase involved in cell wall biosynthesis
VLFIDSDDSIEKESIEKIVRQIENDGFCDVLFLKAGIIQKDGSLKKWTRAYDKSRIWRKSRDEVLAYLSGVSRFPVSACVKLLKRDFLLERGIFFSEGIVCEDVDHMIHVLLNARSFNCCDFWYYRVRAGREGSVMTDPAGAVKRFESTLQIIDTWLNYTKSKPHYTGAVFSILAVQYLYFAAMYATLPADVQKSRRNEVLRLSWLMREGVSRIFLPVRFFYSLFGLKITAAILSLLLL